MVVIEHSFVQALIVDVLHRAKMFSDRGLVVLSGLPHLHTLRLVKCPKVMKYGIIDLMEVR